MNENELHSEQHRAGAKLEGIIYVLSRLALRWEHH